MTRQAVASRKDFPPTISLGDHPAGTRWEGKYIGRREIPRKDGTTTAAYEIKDGDNPIEFWETASLERQLTQVPTGAYVWITYNGKIKTKSGRSIHDVNVEMDPDYNDGEIPL